MPLLGVYLKDCKSICNRNICTPMLIAAVFAEAKVWNQPKCSITNKWIMKMWHIYIHEEE
jgi:hypothetical protein